MREIGHFIGGKHVAGTSGKFGDVFNPASGEVTASAYAGRHGVPAYFPASTFAALLDLSGDQGARELLRSGAAIDLPNGELDIDTAADVLAAERLFGTL